MAVPVVALAEAGVAKITLSKELCVHACTETHTAPNIYVLLLPLGWFMPLEPSLKQRQSVCTSGCPAELLWDAGKELSPPLLCFACLQPSVFLNSVSQKHPLPPASSIKPIHHSWEKKNLAMDFLHRAWLRPIMILMSRNTLELTRVVK